MQYKAIQHRGINVVVIGDFNPAIFQPSWFEKNGLISEGEISGAIIEVISSDVAVFTVGWVKIECAKSRLVLTVQDHSQAPRLKDLSLGIFRLLSHTPIKAIGINYSFHFIMNSVEDGHKIGHTLAPKEIYNGVLTEPGLLHLTIRAKRPDALNGHVNLSVSPSPDVPDNLGILFNFNSHVNLLKTEEFPQAGEFLVAFPANWSFCETSAWFKVSELLNRIK